MPDTLSLAELRSTRDSLARIPSGEELIRLASRLGLWTEASHNSPPGRKPFPTRFSDLGPDELSDLYASWISDAGRLSELCSGLSGHRDRLSLQLKAERARARSRARRANPEVKVTSGQLDDEASSDLAVQDLESSLELVTILLASAEGAKEATNVYLAGISREITYRTEQMKARVYGA